MLDTAECDARPMTSDWAIQGETGLYKVGCTY